MKIAYKLSLLFFLALFSVTGMAQAPYCTPTYSTGCDYGDGLVNVKIGSVINQPIGCSGAVPWFNNYTATPATLLVGTAYTVTVQVGYSSTYVSVYMDLNNDNLLTGAGELLIGNLNCTNSYQDYTATMTIPVSTTLGNHRLRFRTNWLSTVTDPCASYSYGNAGDFTINVTEPGPAAPVYTTGCASGDGLSNFKLNTIDQAIACTGTPSYYHNYSATVQTDITAGLTYPLTVQAAYPGTNVAVWVDLNNNDVYDQPADVIVGNILCVNAGANYTANFTVPNGTTNGLHRLRFRTNRGGAVTDPVASLTYGNAGDFKINVKSQCTPTYNPGCALGDGITSFKLNSINQAIACDGAPDSYFHDYTGVTSEVVIGQPTTVVVKAGFSNTYVTVWVDLNGNHIFDQATETLLPSLACPAANTSYSGTFTVPAGTSLGNHLLRFRTNWLSAVTDPCAAYSFGNAADFTISLVNPVAPIVATTAPTGVTTTGGTMNALINAKGSNTTVSFEYGLSTEYGTVVSGVPGIVFGTLPTPVQAVLTDLIPNQTYHYRVLGSNVAGSVNGTDFTFSTCPAGPAGSITGPSPVCRGTEGQVYSVEPIVNATGYNWTLPSGAMIIDGENTNSITVAYTVTAISGTVSVYGTAECGNGAPASLPVTVSIAPDPTVSGADVVCANDAPSVYTTQAGMTAYEWWVSPNGMIIDGGTANDNTVTVKWYSNGAGSLNVNYNNGTVCAATYQPFLQVTINYQPVPVITGSNVTCVGVEGNVYTTEAGMSAYSWTFSEGATITAGGTATDNTATVVWTSAGNKSVNVNYSGANGCSATAATEFGVLVNPEVAPTIAGAAEATTGGLGFAYTTEANWSNYTWTVSEGGTITAGGTTETNNVVVVWNTAGPNWVSVNYSNGNCTPVSATVFAVNASDPAPAGVSGIVSYANAASTPMKNTTVQLKDINGSVVSTTTTNSAGAYNFPNVENGFYTVAGQTSKSWGGVNSTDALLAMRHFIVTSPLAGISLSAADVNANSSVNAVDALLIAKRYVNQIAGFSAGDWVFEITPVVVNNTPVTHNMTARCYGDLNGSYVPADVKLLPTVSLQTQGTQEITSGMSFSMPFSVNAVSTVGAVSLAISYPADYLTVEGVEMDNTGELTYSVANGELRISWFSLAGMNTENQIVTLKLKAKDLSNVTAEDLSVVLDGSSEISDRNANVFQNVSINCPKLSVAANTASITNYPNPFAGTTTISYNTTVDGNVSLVLYNIVGEEVSVLINNEFTTAANHQITLSSNKLEAGIYVCKLYVNGMVYSQRISVIK